MSYQLFVCRDPEETASHCAAQIVTRLEQALAGRANASFAISGGSSPKPLFAQLAKTQLDWSRIHLFWVDERPVGPADPQSNFGSAYDSLIHPARVPNRNVHRIQGELRPDEAARRYDEEMRSALRLSRSELPHLDVIHCGLGADGHCASLFPEERLLEDRENICGAVWVEKLGQWRITLLPGALLAAKHIVFYVTGAEKAQTVRDVLEGEYDPSRLPAQLLAHHARHVVWFLDQPAAALLG